MGSKVITRCELANAVRALSMDAVQAAKSGHPGMPMGMADIAEVLWNDFLKHDPNSPSWPNRDRFVLSNGHGSMLLYSLLHLTGYNLSLDELRNFRQLHSKTPGHPEHGHTPGVETTTGPLGQGIANAVGMAIAEKSLSARFNRGEFKPVDHFTYVFLGDGCLMEGVSHEACSLAGTLGLGKLIAFWDDNGISIDGRVIGWFTDDTAKRFEAYGWHVIRDVDGHDPEAIHAAITEAQAETNRPTLIDCKTIIGYGAPNLAGSEKTHGTPLGEDELSGTKAQLGWPYDAFETPETIYSRWDAKEEGQQLHRAWDELFDSYRQAHPDLASELESYYHGQLPSDWLETANELVTYLASEAKSIATRKASLLCLEKLAPKLPQLIGGSADLSGSNLTSWSGCRVISRDKPEGDYIHYGVREFGMGAIMNGLAIYGGFIPYGGTFLTFLDYCRNAVRMSALMKQRVIYLFTHDSIGLGEDGPTHQPVEHLTMLRATPNVSTWRPCDAVETAVAWREAIAFDSGPTALCLSRQNLPHQERDQVTLDRIGRGGYVLKDCEGTPAVILIATGSEIALAVAAYESLRGQYRIRVVSMPSVDRFLKQDAAYQKEVLPSAVQKRLAIEAGSSMGWYQFVGLEGLVLGLDRFGESAPAGDTFSYLGFTQDVVEAAIKKLLGVK